MFKIQGIYTKLTNYRDVITMISIGVRFNSCTAVLGDSLGSFGDGVLGKLSWKKESDSSLDLSGGESVLLVVSYELRWLKSDLLEDIVDEGVHDVHWSLGNTSLWVHLLQDSVDVNWESFSSSLLVSSLACGFLSFLGYLLGSGGSFSWSNGLLWCHFVDVGCVVWILIIITLRLLLY